MNLLSGLEKFGLEISEDMDIFEEDKPKTSASTEAAGEKPDIPDRGYVFIGKRHPLSGL